MLGGEEIDLEDMHEIEIPTSEPFVYIFRTGFPAECTLTQAFDPEVGQQYEAVFSVNEGRCSGTLTRLVPTSDGGFRRAEEESFRMPQQCEYPGHF
jgi:hypothetical protein